MSKLLFFTIVYFTVTISLAQIKPDTLLARKNILVADSLFEAGNYEISIEKLAKADLLYLKYGIANAHFDIAFKLSENYIRQAKYDEAKVFVQEQIASLSKQPKLRQFYNPLFISALGEIELNKGRTDLAIDQFQKALEATPTNAYYLSEIYNKLGVAQWVYGNTDLALEFQMKALNIRKQIFGEKHIKTAAIYNNIGLSYSRTEPEKALEYYQKALFIYLNIYKDGKQPALAIAYSNVGFIYNGKKEYNQALNSFEKALAIWTAIYSTNHPSVAFTYSNIGQIFIGRNSYAKAQTNLQMALDIYIKYFGEKYPDVASTYNQLGNLYEKQGKYKQALTYFHKAIVANCANFKSSNVYVNPKATDYYNPNILLTSLTLKSRTLENIHFQKTLKRKDLLMALRCLETADTLLDNIRQSRTNKADKIALGAVATEVYENGIKMCLALADVSLSKGKWNKKAFYFNEKSKSAVLLEAISEAQAKNFAGIADSLLEKEKQLKADIAFNEQKVSEHASNAKLDKVYRDKLFDLNRKYEVFSKKLEVQFPEYYNLKFNVKIADVAAIQQVIDKKTALISYFNSENAGRLYVFIITQKDFEIFDVSKSPDFEKLLIGLRNSILFNTNETYFATASALYTQLFPKRPKVEKLILVPDGKLGTIPFEALLQKKPNDNETDFSSLDYLARKYSCSYDFSATLFGQSQRLKSTSASNSVFFCAPINFSQHASLRSLRNLPGTETEVRKIDQIFKNKNYVTTSYLNDKATETEVKSDNLKNFRYLHFATHGIVNESRPEMSEIFLCSDAGKNEDGNLYSGEIYNLNIKADLVTLSACQTGLGKITKGEGIIGLSRALLYAGAKNIVVSLWTVSDESTSKLMVDFYADLLKNEHPDYSRSLREAKLQLIADKNTANPYYWAPFVLIGK
ncbi:MAG: CHAT domain-containing protein [Cytophagales bacterium]